MGIKLRTVDHVFRAVLGLVLLYLAVPSSLPLLEGALLNYGATIVGLAMPVTAATRVCPIHATAGVRTCRA